MDLSAFDTDIEGTQMVKKKGIVDIIFIIDVSGSMGPAISQVAKNIANFIDNLNPEDVKEWRVRVFSFSDLEVDSPEIALNVTRSWITHNEQDNVQKLVDQLAECYECVKQGGGADEPESSLDALFLAAKDGFDAHWTERTRAVVLFTDATPKKMQKETLGGDFDGLQLLSQMINDNHVYTFIFAPKHDDYLQIKNNCPKYVNYHVINESGENPVEALKSVNFADVLKILGKSISQASVVS